MAGLFSLQSILNENTAFKSIIQTPTNEVYLNSALPILEKFNFGVNESTLALYSSIAEATSRSEENDKFAEYFKNYKSLVNSYTRNMSELVSKAAINIGTYVDANKSTIDDADSMSVVGEPSIKVYDFVNLDNDDVPHIDIEKAFKKEFKFIGKMMQDLGSAITNDEAKANVLATVCNNLQSEIQDDWVEKCMLKIADCDDDTDCKKTNFASIMYKKFIPEDLRDMNITDSDIQQARLALMNASTLVDGLEKASEEFASGLDHVADEIGAMFFRNQDSKMPIKTDAEGIADRDYKLSPASFNQFNIFMANKCTQITELCNLYLIAMSIKADMIYKYLKQCIDIIEAASAGVDNTPNDDDINTFEDDISNDDIIEPEESDDDLDLEDQPTPDMDDNSSILGNDGGDSEPDQSEDNTTTVDPEEANAAESDLQECAYLFEADLFEINRLYDRYELLESASAYITEADGEKKSVFGRLKELISKLIDSIKRFFTNKSKKIDAYISELKNNDYVTALKAEPIPKGMTIDWIDTEKVAGISISDSKQFKDSDLDDMTQYIKNTWKDVLQNNASLNKISDDIIAGVHKENVTYSDNERNKSIEFLLNYDTTCQNVQKDVDKLKSDLDKDEKAAAAGNINIGESSIVSLEQTLVTYFNEADEPNNQAPPQQQSNTNQSTTNNDNNSTANNSNDKPKDKNLKDGESYGVSKEETNKKAENRVKNYYTANIKMLSAKLDVLNTMANKYIGFLEHILSFDAYQKKKNNKPANNGGNNGNANNQNQNNSGNNNTPNTNNNQGGK